MPATSQPARPTDRPLPSRPSAADGAQRSWVSLLVSSRAKSSTTAVTSSPVELGRCAEVGQKRGVRSIATGGHPQQALPRCQLGRVDDPPLTVDQRLCDGMELHRAETGGVDRGQSSRHVQCAEQRDRQVREVTADALATQQRPDGTVGRAGSSQRRTSACSLTQLITACSRSEAGQAGELARRRRGQAVGLAVAARPEVDDVVGVGDQRFDVDPVDHGVVAAGSPALPFDVHRVQPGAVSVDDLRRFDGRAVDGDGDRLAGQRQSLGDGDAVDEPYRIR